MKSEKSPFTFAGLNYEIIDCARGWHPDRWLRARSATEWIQNSSNSRPNPWTFSVIPFWRSACQ